MKHYCTKIAVTLISSVLILPSLSFNAATAPAKCGNRAELIKTLEERYKEVPVALGISTKNTEAFEVFASEAGTWTVVMTLSNGVACVMAAGHSWQDIPRKIAETAT